MSLTDDDSRAAAARLWAEEALQCRADQFAAASADASFRRYFRLRHGAHSWIVMDAPPQYEDCAPFVRVAALLAAAGVHAPRVLAQDLPRGYLLLDDLGDRTFLDVLDADNADALFDSAIDALIRWQNASRPGVLPLYDASLLQRELALFPDWYLGKHLNLQLTDSERSDWAQGCTLLVNAAQAQPQGFVHRDYMPRNLMLSTPNPGVLDFQDAVHGPLAYDVISLFKDAFLSWPQPRIDGWIARYHDRAVAAGVPLPALAAFRRDCDWIGLQRHLKVLGIFARLTHRDGKPKYLADTPRFLRYVVDVLPGYPELSGLRALFERRVLPRVRA